MKEEMSFSRKLFAVITLISIIWMIPALIHYLYYVLREQLFVYVNWILWPMDLVILGLTVAVFVIFWRRWKQSFYSLPEKWTAAMMISLNVLLFCVTRFVFLNALLAVFFAHYMADRISDGKMKKARMLETVHHYLRWQLIGVSVCAVIFIFICLMNEYFIYTIVSFIGINNYLVGGVIGAVMLGVSCLGTVLLYRSLYLNVLNKELFGEKGK
ncbi:MAG: hypothetical protein IJS38_02830 [Erysipelotrichaceae bacterium]|nr:hypothetical protein [Erysipelotrichaceae bacterium]